MKDYIRLLATRQDGNTKTPIKIIYEILCICVFTRLYLVYRFIRYKPAEKKTEVLLRGLGFTNGVKLSDDESFAVIAESTKSHVGKYHLKGPKAGQYEIILEGLPGLPDNIHSDGHGGFLVTTVLGASPEHPMLSQSLAPHPYIRKMISRLLHLLQMPFELIHRYYPNVHVEKIMHWIGSFHMAVTIDTMKRSVVIRFDGSGKILDVLSSDNTDIITGISSAYIHNGYVWLGSPWNNHALRVPLKQAFPDLAVDGGKTSAHAKSEKQPPKAAASDANAERVKRDTGSAAKPTAKQTAPPATPKPTAAPKPTPVPTTPKPTAAPITTTRKPTAAPTTTPKPTAAPKAAPKGDKPAAADSSSESSEAKRASKSANAESGTNDRTRENAAKTSTKPGKKVEQDASAKAPKVNQRK